MLNIIRQSTNRTQNINNCRQWICRWQNINQRLKKEKESEIKNAFSFLKTSCITDRRKAAGGDGWIDVNDVGEVAKAFIDGDCVRCDVFGDIDIVEAEEEEEEEDNEVSESDCDSDSDSEPDRFELRMRRTTLLSVVVIVPPLLQMKKILTQ